MDYNHIRTLLQKYDSGESSLAEEKELRAFFNTAEHIPTEWHTYQKLFLFFQTERQHVLSDSFQQPTSSPRHHIKMAYFSKVAAAIALILGLGFWYFSPNTSSKAPTTAIDWSKYEPKDEVSALRMTQAAFRKTSAVLKLSVETASQEIQYVTGSITKY